jgi:hypothetical protein
MLLNIALLLFVFGAAKKRKKPYLAAALLGLIKAAIYAVLTRDLLGAVVIGCGYAVLTVLFVYFLTRLDRRDKIEAGEVPVYRSPASEKMKFQWEYLPLVPLLGLIVGGEILLRWARG